MSHVYTIPTRFTAIDQMSPVVKKMAHNMHSMVDQANIGLAKQERLFNRLTPALGHATKQLLSYGSAGAVLAGIGYSGKAIMDYETAIQSLQAVTGVSDEQLKGFKAEITDTATKTKKSATDIAGSFEVIGSMMSEYLTDPKGLKQISEAGITLAKASRQELVPTLESLTSIMNQFDLKANKAGDTVNRLTAGEIVGSLRTNQLAESLQEYGASAYAANVNLSESVALGEALAKQMKTDKIGVGARNILTVLDSAKGLDRKARRDLKRSGVDLGFLMDKTKTLSQRLHELAKISGDATKITSVFGKENKTAAQVIFNQLDTYDAYLAKIKVTNQAQTQAATNSNTLAQSVDQLKNTWINYITTNDQAAVGLDKLKTGTRYITDNLDGIVSTGVNVIKFFALWKATLIGVKVVTTGMNIALGIQNALQLQKITLLEGNIIATRASIITEKIMAATIAISTGNWAALNAVIAANPIGLAVTAVLALGTALYFLNEREKKLYEQYKAKAALEADKAIDKETEAVKRLIAQYWNLGLGIKDATAKAIRFRLSTIDYQRAQVEGRIRDTKAQLEQEKGKLYAGDLFTGAFGEGHAMYGKRAQLAEQLQAQQAAAKNLAGSRVGELQFAAQQVQNGTIGREDLAGVFSSKKSSSGESEWGKQMNIRDENKKFDLIDYQKLREAVAGDPQKITVEFKNAPAGTTATTSKSNITTPNSY